MSEAETTCARCRKGISCEPTGKCWCRSYPPLLSPDDEENCLCASCLKLEISMKIVAVMTDPNEEVREKIMALGPPDEPIEDIDYHINEEGLVQFSSWYLLRRGHCCENNCVNCPY